MVDLQRMAGTHQLQVEHRTGKFAGRKTDVLTLHHATNLSPYAEYRPVCPVTDGTEAKMWPGPAQAALAKLFYWRHFGLWM